MKKLLFIIVMVMVASIGHAQHSNKNIGIVVGAPTGLSFKYWMNRSTAWDVAVAWNLGAKGGAYTHLSYLIHNPSLVNINTSAGTAPLYYGAGVAVSGSSIGVRGVTGLDFLFKNHPLDIFLELSPTFYVVPSTAFDIGVGLGVRYHF